MSAEHAKSLEQLKTDAKNAGWPWKIWHPNDERALLEGCFLDFAAAEKVRRFYKKCLVVPKSGVGMVPFHLLDWWYRDVIAPIFGWKKADGRRRFQKGFITTAKKSGKSTVLAGLPLYMILADNEPEAEAYATAVDRDQASIIFQKTLHAVRKSPSLTAICRTIESQKKIFHDSTGSWFEAISSDADSSEGKNPHLLLADEVHVWKDRAFFNSLMYGDIARNQPLFLMITTAGDDEESVGFEEYEAAKDLLNPDEPYYIQSAFAYISEAKDPDKWDDPQSWLEAQPSLRGEVDHERPREPDDLPATPVILQEVGKLQDKCDEAKQSPRKRREFIRYICNRWVTEVENTWINLDLWDQCGGEIPDHTGEDCWVGLDLSASVDLTAICLCFLRDDLFDLVWKFWIPKADIKRREDDWRIPLRDWVSQGWVETSNENSINYRHVRKTISGATFNDRGERLPDIWPESVRAKYNIIELAADPWNAKELCEEDLVKQDGLNVVFHRQGIASMNEPCKKFELLLADKRIRHGNNPVARWMARHVVVDTDASGNLKPNKKKSRHKIDGIVTAVMAVGRAGIGAWTASEMGL